MEAQRKEVDEWIGTRNDHAEWRAGWGHQFISPKDGSYLTFTPEEPGEETLYSPTDPKVKLTPTLHAAWVGAFRQRHMEKMLQAARLYRLTGERKYLDWTVAQFDFYATHYNEFQPYNSGIKRGKLFGNFLNDATSMITLTEAARIIWDDIPDKQKEFWREAFFYPQVRVLDDYNQLFNIACWARSAQATVSLLYGDRELWEKVVRGPRGISLLLDSGVSSDYIWFEQSLGYHYYVVQALRPFFMEAARRGWIEDVRPEAAIYQNMLLAPLTLRFENGMLPGMADVTKHYKMSAALVLVSEAARVLPTKVGLYYSDKQKNWERLLDPLPEYKADTGLPPVVSLVMDSTRIAVLKSDPWQVFFHYGQIDANHSQSEALSFELCYGGEALSLDPGTVPYSSPLYKEYYKIGLADNVPLVDGRAQSEARPGTLIQFDQQTSSITAGQSPFVPGWAAERTLSIDAGRFLDRLSLTPDGGSEDEAHTLGFLFHLENNVLLESGHLFEPVPDFAAGRPKGFQYWSEVKSVEARDEMDFTLRSGRRKFHLVVRTPGVFRVYLASTPGPVPKRRMTLLVEKQAARAEFETRISAVNE